MMVLTIVGRNKWNNHAKTSPTMARCVSDAMYHNGEKQGGTTTVSISLTIYKYVIRIGYLVDHR